MIDVSFPLLVEDSLAHLRQKNTTPIFHARQGLSLVQKHLETCQDLAMYASNATDQNRSRLREELAITAALIQKVAEDCGLTVLSD